MTNQIQKPFLKWAGGKSRLVSLIKSHLPAGKRFVEPFAGSAVMFLNTDYQYNLIADTNHDLINVYLYLQKDGKKFIDYVKKLFNPDNNTQASYLALRDLFNSTSNIRLKSAIFIYLNKHGFNGLCRYNSKHLFNVPFGLYSKSPAFPEKEMVYFYQKAKSAKFLQCDFKQCLKKAKKGDVVYCDPPYVPISKTANFTSYSSHKFGTEEQLELAEMAEDLSKKGVKVVISNHRTDFTQKIYQKAKIVRFGVQRFISSNGSKREKVSELLAVFDEF